MKALERQFQRFLDNQAAHARNVERALDKHQDRFARQRRELEEAQGEIEELKAYVASMSDKLCHCSKSPDVKGYQSEDESGSSGLSDDNDDHHSLA